MTERNERIGEVVRKGVLLFSRIAPIPSSAFIGAVTAAVITKSLDLREEKVSEILSKQVSLNHISYVEPDDAKLLQFYTDNPIAPTLLQDFAPEITQRNMDVLRDYYPYLYSALVLNRQIPLLLFRREIQAKQYREMADKYRTLSRGYQMVDGDAELHQRINIFADEMYQVLIEIYGAARDEWKNKENALVFDLIDYVTEVAQI